MVMHAHLVLGSCSKHSMLARSSEAHASFGQSIIKGLHVQVVQAQCKLQIQFAAGIHLSSLSTSSSHLLKGLNNNNKLRMWEVAGHPVHGRSPGP